MSKNLAVIILAAGKGERMKSETPKVLHKLCSRPMLGFVLDTVKSLKARMCITVVGYKSAEVRSFIGKASESVVQDKLLGTADAVKRALPLLKSFKGTVAILYGDMPLLKVQTLKKLLDHHEKNNLDATVLTAEVAKPAGYGRILRDACDVLSGIAEEKDADDFQKEIKEINTGVIVFKKEILADAIRAIRNNNKKKEFYLTDIIEILYKRGALLEGFKLKDAPEAMGINSRAELAQADKIMRSRINQEVMDSGVTLVDPDTVFISFGAKIGKDSVIYPFTVIENDVILGKRCSIGPFVHLREGTRLKDDVLIGNFVETVRATIASEVWAKHFSYIGDTRVGKKANIGAGVVTANFDGVKKNNTVIGDGAFIGSDTVIVAPAYIGRGAMTGAGSVITKHTRVADHSVVAGVPAKLLKQKRG